MPNEPIAAATPCLAEDRLAAWSLGKLPGREFDQVSSHLDVCPRCQQLLDRLEPLADSLLAKLREANKNSTIPPDPRLHAILADVKSTRRAAHSTVEGGGSTDSYAPPPPPSSTAAPAQVPDLRFLRRLGRGGMGEVWLAEHVLLRRPVAVKFMLESRSHAESAERFKREMAAVGALDHPNVVRASHAGEADGVLYLIMEYLEGDSLKDLVAGRGPLPVHQACELVRQAALGVQYAHSKGIVHRDIKPSNLLLTPEGVVKVLDLGLARWQQFEASAEPLTHAGGILGTLGFMAPEQMHRPNAVGARADIYALGATLYFLLTGKIPYPDPETHEPIPLPSFASHLPAEILSMTQTMMQRAPEKRFANAALVAEALKPWCAPPLAYQAITSAAPPQAQSHAAPSSSPSRLRNPMRWGAAVALLLVLVGVAFFVAPMIRVQTPQGTLVLEFPKGIPDDAVVSVDGGKVTVKNLDATRGEIVITPGIREIEVRDGAKVFRKDKVDVVRGGTTVLRVEFAAAIASLPKVDPAPKDKGPIGEIANMSGLPQAAVQYGMALSPDGKYVATGSLGGEIQLWDLRAKREVKNWGVGLAARFSQDGTMLASFRQSTVTFWDPASGKEFKSISYGRGNIRRVAACPTAPLFALSLDSGAVVVYDLRTGKKAHEFRHSEDVDGLDFTPDGKFLVSGAGDKTIRVWNLADGSQEFGLEGHDLAIGNLRVSNDGKTVTSIGYKYAGIYEVILWDLITRKKLGAASITGATGVSSLSGDGRRLLLGSPDGDLTCYDVPSGKAIFSEKRHKGVVRSLTISADGRIAVSAADDQILRVWRLPAPLTKLD